MSKTILQIIAGASRVPGYAPPMVKALMKKLDMDERAFALVMNVSPVTVRLWTSGAAKPCGTSKRLMQIFDACPEVIDRLPAKQNPKLKGAKHE